MILFCANVSILPLSTWHARREIPRKKERERKSIAGVGSPTRGGEVLAVRSPHSTDNVTFFNPRFTLFAPPSRSRGRPQTVIVRLLSLYRERLLSRRGSRRGQGRRILAAKTATKEAALRSGAKWEFANRCQGAREFRAGVTPERRRRRRRRRGKKEEVGTDETKEEGRYVRCRECLGRPLQSGDDGARSVYTFWNILRFARTLGRSEFLITCLLVEVSLAVERRNYSHFNLV